MHWDVNNEHSKHLISILEFTQNNLKNHRKFNQ